MSGTKVIIGNHYEAMQDIVVHWATVKKGTQLYAWFCGRLIMCDGLPGQGWEYAMSPRQVIKLIDAGILEHVEGREA